MGMQDRVSQPKNPYAWATGRSNRQTMEMRVLMDDQTDEG